MEEGRNVKTQLESNHKNPKSAEEKASQYNLQPDY